MTEIGYDDSRKGFDGNTCAVMVSLDKQSADIAMGVDCALEARELHMTEEQLDAIVLRILRFKIQAGMIPQT